MYLSKKDVEEAKQSLKRDNDFGMPFHKSNEKDPKRDAFLRYLSNSKTFVPAHDDNNRKFAEPVRETVKQFRLFDYFVIAIFMAGAGGFAHIATQDTINNNHVLSEHRNLSLAAFVTIGAILGFAMGFGISVLLHQESKEGAENALYNRLSVRLFDSMHEIFPDLDEKMLKSCNPEMARVICTLLISNMPAEDVREIQAYATKIARKLRDVTPYTDSNKFIECNEDIKYVLSIVDYNLIMNQDLHNAILAVYRGNVPLQFVLKNGQKTK